MDEDDLSLDPNDPDDYPDVPDDATGGDALLGAIVDIDANHTVKAHLLINCGHVEFNRAVAAGEIRGVTDPERRDFIEFVEASAEVMENALADALDE